MSYRSFLLLLALSLVFFIILGLSGMEAGDEELLLYEEGYPEDLDTLEEFIQSYYLLLDSDNYLKNYKFVSHNKNKLQNDQTALKNFYRKLLELRNGRREQVVIYHLGDSHTQSGYFSGTARSAMQKYFGNAGRGLVFPLKAAKTNQPDDYQISLKGSFQKELKPRSLSGFTLHLNDNISLAIKTNNFFNIDCRFDQIVLISDSLSAMDTRLNPWSRLYRKEIHAAGNMHYLKMQDYDNQCSLKTGDRLNKLYGISLERSEGGLLYHSMGINGAGFYTLADEDLLFEQIQFLQPDLIIVSLGTNDAQGSYRESVVRANIEGFMNKLRAANPRSEILFTLPPDSYKKGRPNADLAKLEKEITDYARAENLAWWNLGEVMGGRGSSQKWRNQQMAAKDLLHYTPKGYMLQGQLLYQAILKGYKGFSEIREIK